MKTGLRFLPPLLCAVCAVSLQIQVTLFQSADYIGLRINLTDLLLPLMGLAILASLLSRQSQWPDWGIRHFYPAIGGLTIILAAALLHTHFTFGEISRWALVNKFAGWFVLVGIMGVGGWIGNHAQTRHLEIFARAFLYFATIILLFQLSVIVLQSYPQTHGWLPYNDLAHFPIAGLMANRNAYGLLSVAVYALATCLYFMPNPVVRPLCPQLFYFCLPFFLPFNGSRAVFIALCLILPMIFLLHRKQVRQCLQLTGAVFLGVAFIVAVFHDKPQEIAMLKMKPYEVLFNIDNQSYDSDGDRLTLADLANKTKYPGDSMRLTILQDAIDLIKQRPISGAGLGGMLLYQKQKHGAEINIIDCTPLWLLVETGAIGLIAFAAFYIRCAGVIFTKFKHGDGLMKAFRLALIFTGFGFAVMSLFHELFYTRFIWFFLGLGLTMPLKQHRAEYTSGPCPD